MRKGSGVPARGYSWPQFTEGNLAGLRSGAWSARKVDPLTEELVAGLLADRPDLARFPETIRAWGRAEARCILLAEWQVEVGLIDRKTGEVRAGRFVVQFERLAADLRTRLGLDPRSEAELIRDQAEANRLHFDLDALRATGRALVEAREAAVRAAKALEDEERLTLPSGTVDNARGDDR